MNEGEKLLKELFGLSAEPVAYSINTQKLKSNEYINVWIQSGAYNDFVFTIKDLNFKETPSESEELSSVKISYVVDILAPAPDLLLVDAINITNTSGFKETVTWIFNDLLESAAEKEEDIADKFANGKIENGDNTVFRGEVFADKGYKIH